MHLGITVPRPSKSTQIAPTDAFQHAESIFAPNVASRGPERGSNRLSENCAACGGLYSTKTTKNTEIWPFRTGPGQVNVFHLFWQIPTFPSHRPHPNPLKTITHIPTRCHTPALHLPANPAPTSSLRPTTVSTFHTTSRKTSHWGQHGLGYIGSTPSTGATTCPGTPKRHSNCTKRCFVGTLNPFWHLIFTPEARKGRKLGSGNSKPRFFHVFSQFSRKCALFASKCASWNNCPPTLKKHPNCTNRCFSAR